VAVRIDIFSTRRLLRTGLFAAGRTLRRAGAGHGLLLAWVETQVAEARAAAEGRTSWAKFGEAALPWAEGLPHGPKLEARGPSSQQADARGLRSSGLRPGVFAAKLCGPRARASSPQVGACGARELATAFFARGPKLELPKLVATDGHS